MIEKCVPSESLTTLILPSCATRGAALSASATTK
jgi:hypothetical protein